MVPFSTMAMQGNPTAEGYKMEICGMYLRAITDILVSNDVFHW